MCTDNVIIEYGERRPGIPSAPAVMEWDNNNRVLVP